MPALTSHPAAPSAAHTPLRTASFVCHVAAVFWCGIMAGFFATYSANVAPALLGLDGAMYAQVQSPLNRHVRHALFFAFFFLPPLWCALALLAGGWRGRGAWGACLLAAGLLYAAGVVLFTRQVNLPLNAYTESWQPGALPADWGLTRDRWNAANHLRSVVSSAAFLLAIVSLVLRRPRAPCAP